MEVEVQSQEVLKLILQFFIENNLYRSARTLQEETNVSLNIVDNKNKLIQDICNGRWSNVLNVIANVRIAIETEFDLFEEIILELIEMAETDCARRLIFESEPMKKMQKVQHLQMRYNAIVQLLTSIPVQRRTESVINQRRYVIAKRVAVQVIEVESSSQLLSIISKSLKYDHNTDHNITSGNKKKYRNNKIKNQIFVEKKKPFSKQKNMKQQFDENGNEIETQTQTQTQAHNEIVIRKNTSVIQLKSHCCSVLKFSADGKYLVSGSNDGFIEFWDIHSNNANQSENVGNTNATNTLMHSLIHTENIAINCIAFSHDSELMSTGNANGSIKIWNEYLNVCTFANAHSSGVTSLEFNHKCSEILSSSLDGICKIHGLKSQRLLKEFKGHSSFINKSLYSADNERIISASKDGCLKIWDQKTQNCLFTISNVQQALTSVSLSSYSSRMRSKKRSMQKYLNDVYGNAANNNNVDEDNANDDNDEDMNGNTDTAVAVAVDHANDHSTGTAQTQASSSSSSSQTCSIIAMELNRRGGGRNEEVFIVADADVSNIFLLNYRTGKVIRRFHSQKIANYVYKQKQKQLSTSMSMSNICYNASMQMSQQCTYAYTVSEPNHFLYCFRLSSLAKKENSNHNLNAAVPDGNKDAETLVNAIKIHKAAVTDMAHHPFENVIATASTDQTIKIWQ